MKIFKKVFGLFYLIFCFLKNINKSRNYSNNYKKNILLNDSTFLSEIKSKRIISNNDICHQFDNLFYEIVSHNPKVILELGVRKGESTFVFNRIQKLLNNIHISIDIEDCSEVLNDPKWIFKKHDSIDFLKNYNSWSSKNIDSLNPDVIFIDTSHLYDETLQEIKFSAEILNNNGSIIFHDTNHNYFTYLDNNIIYNKFNYKPQLGVKLALEKYFDCKFNFKESFIIIRNGWLIKHYPESFGLTVMRKFR
tara:strand:- start:35 stop:784 length:750 start_codon:yes stop_codon:yes gene_type:complete